MTNTLTPTGSLAALMTELVELEESVSDELTVFMWKPYSPDLDGGMIWNELASSPFTVQDVQRWRDTVNVLAKIGIRHTDVDEKMARLVEYIDAFRNIVDDALWKNQPLGGTATKAARTSMRTTEEIFNSIPVLVAEFQLEFWLDRQIVP